MVLINEGMRLEKKKSTHTHQKLNKPHKTSKLTNGILNALGFKQN